MHFDAADIARSRSHPGEGSRLRRAMTKLLQGKPISALVLGGSIEQGGDLNTRMDAYFAQVTDWINATFPPIEGQHTFHNGGRSSTGSPYFASCLHDHVPDKNVDLVFLQFDVNDGVRTPYMNNAHRRALEVLIRKLLNLPASPALVYMHWWSPTTNQGQRSFWNHTVQPESGLLAAYYGLPSVSMRDVWYHHWARNEPGFLSRDVMCSINHPNYLGHLYVADLLIALLQDHLAAAALLPADDAVAEHELPEPMLPGNHESGAGSVCLHDDSLRDALVPGSASGFQFVDDTTSYGTHRWGWVSEAPGDSMEMQVDTRNPAETDGGSWLSMAVLMSYKDRGAAKLECVRECACNPMTIDSLWKAKLSIKEWWHIRVSASEQCVVRLTSTPTGREGGSRFKVEAFTVRPQSTGDNEEGIAGNVTAAGSEWAHNYEASRAGHYATAGAWRNKGSGQ
ncbi:hypothetical protein WJX81_007152 [Elliptochloris bilobata]|uniref:SGNH hydrolase-type esterase domain-containing protein n=1 Tax=Elliptochloris bilobata TaxID=381761 RepID=A0AAW1RQM0_9CHLO